ncbi:hypothetical protein DJ535_11160 [Citrobacter murliniae]|uniref:Uncharacterized protein n=1 Tax=Citrobacter murliniae TaxID=67829 RepID=A0ABY2PU14_9ENTR|nr:hypothetical protein DJ535_11160 [Citrobacter murliniae]
MLELLAAVLIANEWILSAMEMLNNAVQVQVQAEYPHPEDILSLPAIPLFLSFPVEAVVAKIPLSQQLM